MRFPRAALLLLFLACGIGARAQITDGVISDAITKAMAKVLNAPQGGAVGALGGSMANVGQSLSSMGSALSAAYANAGAQAEAALAAFEQQYCTPATFTPSEKVPASFVGHSLAVTFSMGNCTFNESKWIHDDIKELECTEPSISYAKSPASFTSKYHSAPSFSSKECVVTKTFGEAVEKVLFVFDGTQAPDINSLTTKITEEVRKMLGTVTSSVQDLVGNSKGLFAQAAAGQQAAPAFAYQ